METVEEAAEEAEPVLPRVTAISSELRSRLLQAIDAATQSARMRQAYKLVLEHQPVVGVDCNAIHQRATGKDQAIHTYLDKLAGAGWLQRIGRGYSSVTGKPGDLWAVTGVVGENVSNYGHRSTRRKIASSAAAHGGDALRIGRNIWVDVSTALKVHLSPKLDGTAEWALQMLDQSILDEVAALRERLNARVTALVNATENLPTRRQFLAACENLGVPAPTTGKPLNLVAARRKYHQLARAYHPDRCPGNENLYRRATEAFEIIEFYVLHQQTKGGTK